ncbi:MAG TPA: hypothetical protein PLP89_03135, partial [Synergistales bacterium]|nr:hypothetical protein [Synergistales bacterium]
MNISLFVLALSLIFQTAGTLAAMRLLIVARKHPAVVLVAVTGVLMLFRRLRMLLFVMSDNALPEFFLLQESLGLTVSLFLLASVLWAVPRLLGLLQTRDELAEKHSTASQI